MLIDIFKANIGASLCLLKEIIARCAPAAPPPIKRLIIGERRLARISADALPAASAHAVNRQRRTHGIAHDVTVDGVIISLAFVAR